MNTILMPSTRSIRRFISSVSHSPLQFFIYFCAPFAIIMVFAIPPFQAPDEYTHFYKAVWMSYGHTKAVKFSDREVGALLPAKYQQTVRNYSYMWLDSSKKVKPSVIVQDVNHPRKDNTKIKTLFENTAVYPPVGYLPQAAGILATRLIGASVVVQLYAARLLACLTALALVVFAIRLMPYGKWAAVALTGTPLSIMLVSSSANDAITFGACLIWLAMVLKTRASGVLNRNSLLVLCLLALVLGLSKAPYGLLGLLALILPCSALSRSKWQSGLMKAALAILPLFILGIWMLYTKNIYITTNPAADTSSQLHYMLSHILSSSWLLSNTLFLSPVSDYLVSQFIDTSAWLAIRLPQIFVVAYYIFLAFLLVAKNPSEQYPEMNKKLRAYLLLFGIIGSYTVVALVYLSFNPIGTHDIIGINSRYFIPFSFLLIPALGGLVTLGSKFQYRNFLLAAQATIIGTGIANLVATIIRFYAS